MIYINHDDVVQYKHFPRYWLFVQGIHRSPVNYPKKGRWHEALMFSLICACINKWVNNREAGDLRRYRAHCDVICRMYTILVSLVSENVTLYADQTRTTFMYYIMQTIVMNICFYEWHNTYNLHVTVWKYFQFLFSDSLGPVTFLMGRCMASHSMQLIMNAQYAAKI